MEIGNDEGNGGGGGFGRGGLATDYLGRKLCKLMKEENGRNTGKAQRPSRPQRPRHGPARENEREELEITSIPPFPIISTAIAVFLLSGPIHSFNVALLPFYNSLLLN